MEAFRRKVEALARTVTAQPPSGLHVDGARDATTVSEDSLSEATAQSAPSPVASRKYWMPDCVVSNCYDCESKFTTLRRRHHCRVCGQIFCFKCCSNYIPGSHIGSTGNVRVCNYCKEIYDKQKKSNDGAGCTFVNNSSAATALNNTSLHTKIPVSGRISVFENPHDGLHSIPSVGSLPTVGGLRQSPQKTHRQGSDPNLLGRVSLKNPKKLMVLITQMAHPVSGIPLDIHRHGTRVYTSCFLGSQLVQWLQQRNSSTPTETAVAIGQTLIDFGHLKDLGTQEASTLQARFGQDATYRLAGYQRHIAPAVESFPRCLSDGQLSFSPTSFSSLNANESTLNPGEDDALMDGPDWFKTIITNEAEEVFDLEQQQQFGGKTSTIVDGSNGYALPEEEDCDSSYLADLRKARRRLSKSDKLNIANISCPELDDFYARHQEQYITKMMGKEKLSDKWKHIVRSFAAQIVAGTIVGYKSTKSMDIREMVKVKRLPGGSIDDCQIVPGEVFTGRAALVGMPLEVPEPRLLLIRERLFFPRSDKLVSMENLNVQLDKYVKNTVDKLMAFKPDVVLAENEVCKGVVDALHAVRIAIVLKVKPQVLERLALMFDATIVTSLDSTAVDTSSTGSCRNYSCRSVELQSGSLTNDKSTVCFRRSDLEHGCTVLLRGGSSRELGKVKRILSRTLLVACNARYEKAFLLTEYAQTSEFHEELNRFEKCSLSETTLSPFVTMISTFDSDDEVEEENELSELDADEDEPSPCDNANDNLPALVTAVMTSGLEDRNVRDMLADYRMASDSRRSGNNPRRRVKKSPTIWKDASVPSYSKRLEAKGLPIVYSSHSPISKMSPQYCVRPWVATMFFYGELDMPIGTFLEEFCFGYNEECPNRNCSTPLRDHVRRFCLDDTCVTLNVQEVKDAMPVGNSTIQAWRFCTVCEIVTPILLLTEDAWMYSFAMFFLMLIYEEKIGRRGSTATLCQHSLHKDHHICFSKGEILASFKVSKIACLELVTPPNVLQMPPDVPREEKLLLDLKVLSVHGSSIFGQISDRLAKLKADSAFSSCMQVAVLQLMEDEEKEFDSYRCGVDQVVSNISVGEHLTEVRTSILMLKVSILKSVTRWKSKLLQLMEMKRKEEKAAAAAATAKARMPSGNSMSAPDSSSDSITFEPRSLESVGQGTNNSNSSSSLNWKRPLHQGKDISTSDYQLVSPFSTKLHPDLYLPPGVLVDEDQPSTIIAYTMASNMHHEFLSSEVTEQPPPEEPSPKKPSSNQEGDTAAAEVDKLAKKKMRYREAHPHHFQHTFSDESSEFYCSVLFARDFERLRTRVVGPLDRIVGSLASCNRFLATGGKSGVKFYKTLDDRFILKELSRQEAKDFYAFAPRYFDYLTKSLDAEEPTLLAKIVGVFDVGFKKLSSSGGNAMVLLVMENLIYGRRVSWSYDLKGSLRNRLVNEDESELDEKVLMDENLLKSSREKPFYITLESQRLLSTAIENDTAFLNDNFMMDYSLLVAIDGDTNELVLGIIDYVRVYTWDKQLESFIKSSGILGGAGKTPTVVAPEIYRTRFQHAMSKYFTLVPDYWHDQEGDPKDDEES